jgi:tRNA1(Val) A37 N6-methylase TrmN6
MKNSIDEQGNILKLSLGNGTMVLAENHPSVWFPFSPSCIAMCELISVDNCSGKVVMDFAAGSGFLGIVAAKNGAAQVICTDLNPEAVPASKRNWELNRLNPKHLQSLKSNCFDAIKGHPDFEGKIDRIYLNPPALPDTQEKLQARLEFALLNSCRRMESKRTARQTGDGFPNCRGKILSVTWGRNPVHCHQ